jgi:hypothetical protein
MKIHTVYIFDGQLERVVRETQETILVMNCILSRDISKYEFFLKVLKKFLRSNRRSIQIFFLLVLLVVVKQL